MLAGVERPFYLQCLIFCGTLREDVVVEMETGGGCSLHMHEMAVDFSGNRRRMWQETGQARRTGSFWVIYWKKMVMESTIKVQYDMMIGDDGNDGKHALLSLISDSEAQADAVRKRHCDCDRNCNRNATGTGTGTFCLWGKLSGQHEQERPSPDLHSPLPRNPPQCSPHGPSSDSDSDAIFINRYRHPCSSC